MGTTAHGCIPGDVAIHLTFPTGVGASGAPCPFLTSRVGPFICFKSSSKSELPIISSFILGGGGVAALPDQNHRVAFCKVVQKILKLFIRSRFMHDYNVLNGLPDHRCTSEKVETLIRLEAGMWCASSTVRTNSVTSWFVNHKDSSWSTTLWSSNGRLKSALMAPTKPVNFFSSSLILPLVAKRRENHLNSSGVDRLMFRPFLSD